MINRKRKIVLVAAIIMVVCLLSACGGNSSKQLWSVETSVDEFGDVTEESYSYIVSSFEGTFSNSTTSDGELVGKIGFTFNRLGHYYVSFDLLENGDTKATYSDYDNCVLKVKVDDDVYTYALSGEAPNGSLMLGSELFDYSGDELFNLLYGGADLRCIIDIGSSSYTFTIESNNFNKLCAEQGLSNAPAEMTVSEATAIFVSDIGLHSSEAYNVLNSHLNTMQRLTSETMLDEIKGKYVGIMAGRWTPYPDEKNPKYLYAWMYAYEFSDEGFRNHAEYLVEYGNKNYKHRHYNPYQKSLLDTLETHNDLLIMTNDEYNTSSTYSLYKLTDNIYVMAYVDKDTGESSAIAYLLVRCESLGEKGIIEGLENALNDIPLITYMNLLQYDD